MSQFKRSPFTKNGFDKIKIPSEIYQKILDWYLKNKSNYELESKIDSSIKDYVKNLHDNTLEPKIVDIKKNKILSEELTIIVSSILKEWSGKDDLTHTSTYGIRIYQRGDVLQSHVDKNDTHILSAILSIQQENINKPWGLQIKDHEGWWNEVFLQEGEMLLYESDILEHGRMYPLNGDTYSNLFIHFKPTNYRYGSNGLI
jgi:prolyl 4-hydroxylase